MNKWQKLAFAASTVVANLGMLVGGELAQAASFFFDFDGKGQGSLSFTNTPLTGLTGVGEESISINDLSNLAEDVSFEFSYPTNVYDIYDGDYRNTDGYERTIFNFLDGKLIGMNFLGSLPFSYYSSGGSRSIEIDGFQYLLIKNDRFTEFVNVNQSSGGLSGCDTETRVDGYYTDPETNEEIPIFIDVQVCRFDSYEYNESHQIEEEGISYQITSLYRERIVYTPGEEIINEYPNNSSGFIRFDELPQITFRTLKPINSNPTEPTSIPEPQPFTIFGLGTAMVFGVVLKKAQKTKN